MVHLRWLPLDLSDSASEKHCGVHKLRLQLRRRQNSKTTPVCWGVGWGGVGGVGGNHKASAARCLPVGSWWRHRFLQCVASLRKLNCPAATHAFHAGILKRNLLIRLNSGGGLTQFLMTACCTVFPQMMNIYVEDEHFLKGILKYILYQSVYIKLLVVHTFFSLQQLQTTVCSSELQEKMFALHNECECF